MLHLHRSERADRLAVALAQVLREPLPDPFEPDVVAVPAKGVERWLAQRLSHVLGAGTAPGEDGVCANVRFPSPAAVLAEALAAGAPHEPGAPGGLGAPAATEAPGGEDPWERGRLVWPLLDTIDASAGQVWCAALANHLGAGAGAGAGAAAGAGADEDVRRGRRLAVAGHLAALFDSYRAHRPEMLRQWARGEDGDGAGARLPADLAWQAELWRQVRERIGAPGPAERLNEACGALRDQPGLVALPGRLSLFGPTRLSTAQIEVLAALAAGREVHLWLPHPSAALWQRVAPYAGSSSAGSNGRGTSRGGGTPARPRRRTDPTAQLPANPLLASLGRDARELQLTLAGCDAEIREHHHPLTDRPATLLGRLQDALREDRPPLTGPPGRPLVASADRSVQVHACHGPARQVEVLRDVLVGLLADDPTLEPRDLLVMCPDIEEYAPLISATFGLGGGEGAETGGGVTGGGDGGTGRDTAGDLDGADPAGRHPGHRLRVRLADRSLRQTNPLLGTLATLLELADARLTGAQVLDLAASPPVRRRFRFSADDLDLIRDWVLAAGVRWGLDAAHRAPFGLPDLPQNTWRAGLDRILLGAAMADDAHWVGQALPLDEVDSGDIDLAGRLAELVDRLADVLDALSGQHPLERWLDTLGRALDALTETREADAWQAAQARRELAQVRAEAGDRARVVRLTLADVRALLADRLQGRPTRANFRTGNLTMCSMVPMRSVPHRVIALLGLDDGRFPRSSAVDGDDILARDPCVGERDLRSEDRQLLLDAVLAAREHLVVLYTGADPRTNAPRPPAVPVGEILDALDATATGADGRPAREHVVVRHPLQPFDPRNFTSGALGRPGPFSFDRQVLRGARRAALPREAEPPFLAGDLPAARAPDLALDDLIRFLEHPASGFLRQRLDVTLLRDAEDLPEALRAQLDPLEKWAVGDRLLQARLAGVDPETCRQAEWRRGTLPPGRLGWRLLTDLLAQVEPLVSAAAGHRREARTVDVLLDLDLPGGPRRLVGSVGQVHGDAVLRVTYSRLAAKHRLRAWAQLLALAAADPGRRWTAVTIGRAAKDPIARSTLAPVPPDAARELLTGLVDLRDRGLRAPLPLPVKAAAAYAGKRGGAMNAANALAVAGKEWTGEHGERTEPAHELVWGAGAAFEALLADAPRPDEHGPGWPSDEHTRFAALARRLWDPLLARESLDAGRSGAAAP